MKNGGFAFVFVAIVLMVSLSSAHAGDAKHCVRIGMKKADYDGGRDRQTITNTCSTKIEVLWCHNSPEQFARDGVCDTGGKYYQKHKVLEPGEVEENQFSLPAGARIFYGACEGGYYSTEQTSDGAYRCKER